VDDAKIEQILRDHATRENLNPARVGCPTPDEIRTLAFNSQQGDLSINEHLTVCSECFGLYQKILLERRSGHIMESSGSS
jgi:hypothetical protein